jgi:hypothetical protein
MPGSGYVFSVRVGGQKSRQSVIRLAVLPPEKFIGHGKTDKSKPSKAGPSTIAASP